MISISCKYCRHSFQVDADAPDAGVFCPHCLEQAEIPLSPERLRAVSSRGLIDAMESDKEQNAGSVHGLSGERIKVNRLAPKLGLCRRRGINSAKSATIGTGSDFESSASESTAVSSVKGSSAVDSRVDIELSARPRQSSVQTLLTVFLGIILAALLVLLGYLILRGQA